MVSAVSFGWCADFGKTLTIIQRSSQQMVSTLALASRTSPGESRVGHSQASTHTAVRAKVAQQQDGGRL